MKHLLLFVIVLMCINCYGQNITGIVVDKSTKLPIHGALVSLGASKAYTDATGGFSVIFNGLGDSLKVSRFTYKPYTLLVNKATRALHIELDPAVISLNTVIIHSTRNFKQDSINNRVEYAKQFNYTAPKVKDIFSTGAKQPGELLSINLLTLVEVLTKKSTPEYKFNKILLRDEQAGYVDHKFNRGIVAPLTGLKGDTLSAFLTRYRPTFEFAKKATDYDMINYIKKSCKEFLKDGATIADPFHDAE